MNANLKGIRAAMAIVGLIVSIVVAIPATVSAAPATEFCEEHAELVQPTTVYHQPNGEVIWGELNPNSADGFGRFIGVVDETYIGGSRWVRISYQLSMWLDATHITNENCTTPPAPIDVWRSHADIAIESFELVRVGTLVPIELWKSSFAWLHVFVCIEGGCDRGFDYVYPWHPNVMVPKACPEGVYCSYFIEDNVGGHPDANLNSTCLISDGGQFEIPSWSGQPGFGTCVP